MLVIIALSVSLFLTVYTRNTTISLVLLGDLKYTFMAVRARFAVLPILLVLFV